MKNQITNKIKSLGIISVIALIGAQGCATAADEVDCEVLSHSDIQQFELQIVDSGAAARGGLELCVVADNYNGCDLIEAADDKDGFVVTYDTPVSNIRNISIRKNDKAAPKATPAAAVPANADSTAVTGKHVAESAGNHVVVDPSAKSDRQEAPVIERASEAAEATQLEIVAVTNDNEAPTLVVVASVEAAPKHAVAGLNENLAQTDVASCE